MVAFYHPRLLVGCLYIEYRTTSLSVWDMISKPLFNNISNEVITVHKYAIKKFKRFAVWKKVYICSLKHIEKTQVENVFYLIGKGTT